MKVHFYGRLGELIGREADVDAPAGGWTIADLRDALVRQFPDAAEALASAKSRASVDDRFVPDDFRPSSGQIVEFFPPLSGG